MNTTKLSETFSKISNGDRATIAKAMYSMHRDQMP
jgi:hypothetical protein